MLSCFKNILINIRSKNLSLITKGDYATTFRHNASRAFCQCGRNNKNYSEKQIRFNGVHVTVEKPYENGDQFELDLRELLTRWKTKDNRRSAFLEIPILQSHLICIASAHGFTYHHARDDKAVLSIWLEDGTTSKLPPFANHTLGVAGACFNQETMDVLLVQDKGRFSKWWKFPGGFADKGEFIGETAVRETFEETGIRASFQSVLGFGEMGTGAVFDQSSLFFICRLNPLTFELNPCPDEIVACQWMKVKDVINMKDTTLFVKRICQLFLKGVVENSFSHVDITGEETTSWLIPEKKYIIYHRPLR